MCGIAAIGDFEGPVSAETLERMCLRLEHRGPDSAGSHHEDGLGLGMRRLAIIDIAGGEQPIYSEDGAIVAVVNGEIYNHEDLRAELVARGHRFASRCDSEVLVHLYEEHGDRLVDRLRGMFAFAIWDRRRRRLFCARDRVGKKPLFWARDGSRFWLASEFGALLEEPRLRREVDPNAIDAYLALQYVPHPLSAFQGIRKLPPASTLVLDEETTAIDRYWRLDYSSKYADVPDAELAERAWEEIVEATRIRLMSDVPLGAFLSGGIDSSAVVAAMSEQVSTPVRTFSIGFSDREFDEVAYARRVAERFGTDHEEFQVDPNAAEIFPAIARAYGEPYADPSAIPSFFLAEMTRRQVTVALNGDGGDESFAGYGRYLRGMRLSRFDRLPSSIPSGVAALGRLLDAPDAQWGFRYRAGRLAAALKRPAWARYAMSLVAFDRDGRDRLLRPEFAELLDGPRAEDILAAAWTESTANNDLERMLGTDIETYLPGDLLVKMDIATMAHSLEARSPFLDHELMEFAAAVPPHLKLAHGDTKRLLKLALRGRVPDEILDRPKMGFGVPLVRWFREELRDFPADLLLDPRSLERGYFRRREVERLIAEHHRGDADHSLRLWILIQLELWHREVVEAPVSIPA
jgi:asparagine synthase (glutamine-hydrolysing)